MSKWLDEMKLDIGFIRSHTLQPGWYKALKIVILAGVLVSYGLWFGWRKSAIFAAAFFILSLGVHLAYRAGTHRWQRSWLDFVVVEEQNQVKAKSIGAYYYAALLFNACLSVLLSQLLG